MVRILRASPFLLVILAASCTEKNPNACANGAACPGGTHCVVLKDAKGHGFSRCIEDDGGAEETPDASLPLPDSAGLQDVGSILSGDGRLDARQPLIDGGS